jgi:hypothetical protein
MIHRLAGGRELLADVLVQRYPLRDAATELYLNT